MISPTLWTAALAALLLTAPLQAQVPNLINYQGRIVVGTTNFNSPPDGQFKFALVDGTGNQVWRNQGTGAGEPPTAVSLTVIKGLYSVTLGDTSIPNMAAIPSSVFTSAVVRLRVWFNDGVTGFQQLSPDQRVAPAAYLSDGSVTTAKLASGLTVNGSLVGNASTATAAGTFTGTLAGDVTGPQGATVVGTVGGVSAANVAAGATLANGASALHGSGTLVRRDGAGNVTFGTVAADLAGNANTATIAGGFTGPLAGDVTGTQGATVVSTVGAVTATNVAAATNLANAATSTNTVNAIVRRDGSGNFSAGAITLAGNLALPGTSSASTGVVTLGGTGFLHRFGFENTFLGTNSGNFTMTGQKNAASGNGALRSNTAGNFNVATGSNALYNNTTGSSNVANGYRALYSNSEGSGNTAVGDQAMQANTYGNDNTASGDGALASNTIGNENTAFGSQALVLNTEGLWNTAVGSRALSSSQLASGNTAIGFAALDANTTGFFNTAVGFSALQSDTTGYHNTALGNYALSTNLGGFGNSAVGHRTLFNATGNYNIAIGNQAGENLTTGNENIAIGSLGAAGESLTTRIGAYQNRAFIAGIFGATVAGGVTVYVKSDGQLGTISSSRRYKEDITDMSDASARLHTLRPVTFRYKKATDDGEKPLQYGLIAEEVADAFPELAVFNAEGEPETVKYHDLTPLLLNEVQKLRTEKDELRTRIEKLESLILKGTEQ